MDFSTVVEEAALRARGIIPPNPVRARFAVEPELDAAKTKETKRPEFKQTVWLYLQIPGQPYEERFRATEASFQTYAKEYHWFLDQEKVPTEGMPIGEWNAITSTKAAELKWAGIKTVEELARWDLYERPLSQDNAALVAYAQEYLSGQDEKDKRIAALEEELAKLKSDKPKRGRPRNAKVKAKANEPIDDSAGSGGGAGDISPVVSGGESGHHSEASL